jgi:hypothetical protein
VCPTCGRDTVHQDRIGHTVTQCADQRVGLLELAKAWRLNFHVIPAEPDLLTVLIAGGGFDHLSPDRQLKGQLAVIMIAGPAAQAHTRYGSGSLWGVRAEESRGRRMLYRHSLATETATHATKRSPEAVRAELGGIVPSRRRHHHLRADLGLAPDPRIRVPGRPGLRCSHGQQNRKPLGSARMAVTG